MEISPLFFHLLSTADFPRFYYNVRCKSGVTFVRRCFRDEHKQRIRASGDPTIANSVQIGLCFSQQINETMVTNTPKEFHQEQRKHS